MAGIVHGIIGEHEKVLASTCGRVDALSEELHNRSDEGRLRPALESVNSSPAFAVGMDQVRPDISSTVVDAETSGKSMQNASTTSFTPQRRGSPLAPPPSTPWTAGLPIGADIPSP